MYVGNNGKGWAVFLPNQSGYCEHRNFAWVVRPSQPSGGSWSLGAATYFRTRAEAEAVMATIPKETMKAAQERQGLY